MLEAGLVVRIRMLTGLLPLSAVAEVMRPLPLDPIPGSPPYVRGLSMIRGKPVPVADLGMLIGADGDPRPTRFVTLRLDQRQVGLAVEEVVGIQRILPAQVEAMPPLLRQASPEVVQGLAALDGQLLLVLRASRFRVEEAAA